MSAHVSKKECTERWLAALNVMAAIFMILAAAAVLLTLRSNPPAPNVAAQPVNLRLGTTAYIGSRTAPLAVVEYGDYQCAACITFMRDVFPKFHAAFVATGKVAFSFRHYPLDRLHPLARGAAVAAACAGQQGRFWEMHERLFGQPQRLDRRDLVSHAAAAGLDLTALSSCQLDDGPKRVNQDVADARQLRISATPSLLIGSLGSEGDVQLLGLFRGAVPYDRLAKALDRLLADKS